MKKVMRIALACVLLCVGLCGCGGKADPVGEYSGESFNSHMMSHMSPYTVRSTAFTVKQSEGGYTFAEEVPTFEGTATVRGGKLVCTREDSSDTGYKRMLEDGTYAKEVSYLLYEDYLVSEETDIALYSGELPKGSPSECIVSDSISRHAVGFSESGDCEIQGYLMPSDSKAYSAIGTYTVDGPILNVTITKYTSPEGETKTGEYSFCLFVKDGKIYETVYKKIVE